MKKKTIIIGIIIFLLVLISNLISYKIKAADLVPNLYYGIIEKRTETDRGYAIGNPNSGGSKIWNIVKYTSSTYEYFEEDNIYCVKAEVGFSNENKTEAYDVSYDMKNERETIAQRNDILKGLVNGGQYDNLLALADFIYIPGVSSEQEKKQLLEDAGIYTEEFCITDDEIEAVQQAAIWYFTNYEEGGKYDKYNNIAWLYYTEDGITYKSLSSDLPGGSVRQSQAETLYKYLIDKARENASKGIQDPKTVVTIYASTSNNEAQPLMKITKLPKEFDLSLRKYITKVNGTNISDSRVPTINTGTLKEGTTAEYKHRKDPVEVKTGDVITYNITIYNEGEKEGRATKIVDQLPTGLKFVEVESGNFEKESYNETTNKLTLKRKATNKENLAKYTEGSTLSSETIQIKCEVIAESKETQQILTNLAWISEEVDGVTEEVITNEEGKDRDSEPSTIQEKTKDELVTTNDGYIGNESNNGKALNNSGNYFAGQQDDDDFEKVVIPKAEGSYQIQLEKVDKEGNKITTSGAEFKYTLPGQSGTKTGTTTNGVLNLGTVQITSVGNKDTITIEETKAPEGYNKLIGSLTIQVEKAISGGKYVATGASITAGNTNSNASVKIENGIVKITVKNEKKEFDLALRKYISKVDGTTHNRVPNVDTSTISSEGTATYNHTKEPIVVKRNSEIIYTIRVYNEGEVDGYAEQITDYLPEELEFLPEHEINKQYGWILGADGRTVTTDYLSKEKEETEESNELKAFDGENLDYKEVQIACKVKEEAESNVKLTNLAEITEDNNDYGYEDKDSTPDNVKRPTDEDLPGYKDDEIGNKDYIPGQEDDDDFEKVIVEERTGSYQVQLEKVDKEGNKITTSGAEFSYTLPGQNAKTGTTTNGVLNLGTVQITDVANKDTITIQETKAPEGYNKLIDSITLEVTKGISEEKYVATGVTITPENANASVKMENGIVKITVQNEKITGSYQIQLEKVDKEGNKITTSGTEFSYTLPGQNAKTGTTTNGVLNLGTVQITEVANKDTITIQETKAPEGYNKLIDSITLEVTKGTSGGKYIATGANITSGNTNSNASVKIENGIVKITVRNEKKEFDLALRKYISKIGDKEYDRAPDVDTSTISNEGTATYNHTKEPILVKRNSEIIYTIRVYNEGEVDGYAEQITDYLPEELEFLPEHEINKQYGWILGADGRTVTTDYLSKEKEETEESNELKAFDGENLDYKEVQIACKVKEEAESNVKLTNLAEITEDNNEYGYEDKDSTPDDIEKPTDEDLPGYKDDEIGNKDYIPGQEDDDDFEKVIVEERTGSYQIQLEKVDKDDNTVKLSGAEFSYTLPGQTEVQKGTTTSGVLNLGTVQITDVANKDTITIQETKAPEGYNKLIDSITLEVTKGTSGDNYVLTDVNITSGNTTNAKVSLSGNVITITVQNQKITGDYEIQLEKVDSEGNRITTSGAEFSYTLPGQSAKTGSTTDGVLNLGTVQITEVANKDIITIQETKAPEGYNKLIDSITVEVTKAISGNNYVITNANITSGNTNSNASVKIENGIVKITVKNERKEFDLALRKYISKVDETTYDRVPNVDTSTISSEGTGTYNHTKEPILVKRNSEIIYTIRVYNEGEVDGYAEQITDYLPEELEFLPEHEINKQYGWVLGEDGRTVTTDYLSKEKETTEGANELKAFDGENLDYKEVQIACKVKEEAESNVKLTNLAEITEDNNDYGYEDKDSTPDDIEKPTDEDLPGYKDDEIGNKDYIPGQEDDDDFEKVIIKDFDLALRKFITKVDNDEVTTRIPEVSYDRDADKITYNHTKDPVEVVTGNVIEYTIRVYNEGDIAGYATEVTDDIPDGLRFLPENETNIEYRWVMYDEQGNVTDNVEDAVKITTDYLSKDQEKTEGENLLQAFNPEEEIGEGNPDYRDIKVAFEVIEPNGSDKIIVNSAQISEDSDENGNPVEDIDSIPDEWNDGEDDQDREYIKLTYFDLALRKWVTEAIVIENGQETVTQTGHTAEMDPEPVVKVELYRKDLNNVTVKFRYKIRITNEGDIAGYATEITDYVPEGLRFVAEDNPGWTDEGNNVISTRLLENTLLQPGESAEVEVVLTWINGEDNMGLKTNIAEISEDYNDKGVPDRDSTPDNQVEGEDDIDDAPVLLSIETGRATIYIALGLTVLGTLAGGLVLIKKFVL